MATADIAKQAVFDPRIVQSGARYAVDKGALSLTNSPYNAIAASASQHTYNINVPSQNVFVDRAMDWSSYVLLSSAVTVNPAVAPLPGSGVYEPILRFGKDAALAPFPLHQLTATLTATINDTTTVINLDTVLNEVLRLTDYKKNRLPRTCPSMLDKWASYNDAALGINNPLASYSDSTEPAEMPNGAWGQVAFCDPTGIPLSGSGSYVYGGVTVVYQAGMPVRGNAVTDPVGGYPLFIRFYTTEKLVLSPFVFGDAYEYNTGLFGINNIQLVMNLRAGAAVSRVLRNTTTYGRALASVALANFAGGSPFSEAKVNVQFLTPSLDLPLPAKSVVPFMEFPRYISNNYPQLPAGQSTTLQSQTIVLPQIPDALIIYAKPSQYADTTQGDWYMPITKLSVNFDNFAGLLSSHTTEQLYHMTVHNGLEMDYNEWRGKAFNTNGSMIQTVGGFLVLKPGQDITLQSGQAASLIGNFTLQFQATIENNSGSAASPVLYVIAVNSGFFETLAGSSRIIKGVLSEADIISAEPAPEGGRADLDRIVGGGFFSRLGSILSKAKDIYTATKPAISAMKGALPEGKMKDVLGKVGYGHAGAGAAGAGKKSLSSRVM